MAEGSKHSKNKPGPTKEDPSALRPQDAPSLHKKIPRGGIYVIQRHDASHLHYDLRLEMDGVLKSWALPKEPPKVFGTKRLAVMVGDHEIGYEKFEGVIPEGQYGQGTVKIWDSGYYVPVEINDKRLVIDIRGRRLKGSYALVRFNPRSQNKKNNNWLFFRVKNEKGAP